MRIGELAQKAGVTADTIRYYERSGLLAPAARLRNRYRVYELAAVDDLRFIKKAQALGMRLADIRHMIEVASDGETPCDYVRGVLERHLLEVEQKLAELKSLRRHLTGALSRLDDSERHGNGYRCVAIDPD